MYLDAVETCGLGVFRRFFESGNYSRQFIVAQRAWFDIRLLALRRVHFITGDRYRARCHRLRTVVEQRVASAAAVPDLQEYPSAFGMHGIGDFFPAGDLCCGINARFHPERGIALHCHRRFGDQQSAAGALGLVLDHDVGRHVVGIGAATGQRRHENAIGRADGTELDRAV